MMTIAWTKSDFTRPAGPSESLEFKQLSSLHSRRKRSWFIPIDQHLKPLFPELVCRAVLWWPRGEGLTKWCQTAPYPLVAVRYIDYVYFRHCPLLNPMPAWWSLAHPPVERSRGEINDLGILMQNVSICNYKHNTILKMMLFTGFNDIFQR